MSCIVLVCIGSGALLEKGAKTREHIEPTAEKACNVRPFLAGNIFIHAEKMSLREKSRTLLVRINVSCAGDDSGGR